MMAAMMNVKTEERRWIVMAAARDMNIDVHTIPDTRLSSSVTQTYVRLTYRITRKTDESRCHSDTIEMYASGVIGEPVWSGP